MREWKLRDTVMVVFMVIVVITMYMQMVQNDRLYERVSDMINVVESGGFATATANSNTSDRDGRWLVPDAEPGGFAVVHYNAQPATLNPITYKDVYGSVILFESGVYTTLLERDPESLDLIGRLAESWEISDDKLQITMAIKPEARWSDGAPVVAEDVAFSFRVMMLSTVDAQRTQTYYVDCEKVEAISDRKVRFTWKKKYFKSLEMSGGLNIIPKHVIDPEGLIDSDPKAFAEKINKWRFEWEGKPQVCNGPYLLEEWNQSANRVVLRRNDDYWGPKPPLQKLVFRFISDDTAALQALKADEFDAMWLTPEQWQNQTDDPAFLERFIKRKYYRVTSGYNYIGWNNRRAPFDDMRVRQAMSYLVPRDLIIEKIFYNLRKPVNGPFAMGSKQSNPEIGQWPFDPAKAAALLSEAGFADTDGDGILDRQGKPLTFSIAIPSGSPAYEQVVTLIQDEMAKVGVKMNIDPYEWSVFTGRLDSRDFDACMLGWGGTVEGDPYQIWHSSSSENKGSNHIGYENAEVDDLIIKAREEFDEDARNAMYHRIHEIIFNEQPYTFLITGPSLMATSKRLRNVNTYKTGVDFKEWWVPVSERRRPG